jgi:outer membrane protein assembly factor BamB
MTLLTAALTILGGISALLPSQSSAGPSFDDIWTEDRRFSLDDRDVTGHGRNGKPIWVTHVNGGPGEQSPYQILSDSKLVYVDDGDGVTALNAKTGAVAWHSTGPNERMLLSFDLLVATASGERDSTSASEPWLLARRVRDGKAAFGFRLPPPFEDPGSIHAFDRFFVVQTSEFPSVGNLAFVFDRAGRICFQLKTLVIDMIRLGNELIILMPGKVARFTMSGNTLWSIRSAYGDNGVISQGGIVHLPNGDLIEYEYVAGTDSGVGLKRLDPTTGKVVWEAYCDPLHTPHSAYEHRAYVSLEPSKVRVSSRGSHGNFDEWLDVGSGKQVRRVVTKH